MIQQKQPASIFLIFYLCKKTFLISSKTDVKLTVLAMQWLQLAVQCNYLIFTSAMRARPLEIRHILRPLIWQSDIPNIYMSSYSSRKSYWWKGRLLSLENALNSYVQVFLLDTNSVNYVCILTISCSYYCDGQISEYEVDSLVSIYQHMKNAQYWLASVFHHLEYSREYCLYKVVHNYNTSLIKWSLYTQTHYSWLGILVPNTFVKYMCKIQHS